MCQRRGDWSRTPSRASEREYETDEREEDREWWGVRAKNRLLSFVSAGGGTDAAPETPRRPAVDPETTWSETTDSDVTEGAEEPETEGAEERETEDEREEEPIPADD